MKAIFHSRKCLRMVVISCLTISTMVFAVESVPEFPPYAGNHPELKPISEVRVEFHSFLALFPLANSAKRTMVLEYAKASSDTLGHAYCDSIGSFVGGADFKHTIPLSYFDIKMNGEKAIVGLNQQGCRRAANQTAMPGCKSLKFSYAKSPDGWVVEDLHQFYRFVRMLVLLFAKE